jgi:hypothetical protein
MTYPIMSPGEDLGLAIERQMVVIFGDDATSPCRRVRDGPAATAASDAWFEETKNARGGSMMASAPRILFRAIAPRSSKTAAPPFYRVKEFGGCTHIPLASLHPEISARTDRATGGQQRRTR